MAKIILRSEREIAKMRKAGLLVWQAHRIAESLITPGISTGEVDQAVEDFFIKAKATPLFKGFPGRVPYPAVTCMSVNDAVVHGIPNKKFLLNEGDIVSIDTGCKYDGWCGDSAWTYPVGTVSGEKQKLLEVTEHTLQIAIDMIASRAKYWSDVAGKMEKYVKSHGYHVVEDYVGHGIGREMHEEPQVPNYTSQQLRIYSDFKLRPGLVIAVEPMVNVGTKRVKMLSDHWTLVTTDGSPSAHFEHTIAVTKNGPALLTGPPLNDEEKGWLQEVL